MSHITVNGHPIHTLGKLPSVGSQAPDFTVTKTDLSEIRLKDYSNSVIILNIFPSLDTSTCATAMIKFNEMAQQFKNILILCISADLPFAQKRFCIAEHLNNVQPVSVFRHTGFGNDYGVLITDGPVAGLLSRAIVVIDEQGKIIHTQQVEELSDEPDYEIVIALLREKMK
jgi:thiol peroxidase